MLKNTARPAQISKKKSPSVWHITSILVYRIFVYGKCKQFFAQFATHFFTNFNIGNFDGYKRGLPLSVSQIDKLHSKVTWIAFLAWSAFFLFCAWKKNNEFSWNCNLIKSYSYESYEFHLRLITKKILKNYESFQWKWKIKSVLINLNSSFFVAKK